MWPGFVALSIAAGFLIPLLFNRRYYWIDDTQSGAYGQWYEIGNRVLEGNGSFLNPTVWQSGNYLAEGAWGLFSPLLWGVGLASHVVPSAIGFAMAVKLACMIVGGLGLFLLAREFGADRPWAAAVAVAAPFAGMTFYMDATSWVNGLMAWALMPLAWATIRRAVFSGRSPAIAIVAGASMIGIGYVHATIFLGIAVAATVVEAFLSRDRVAIVRSFAIALAVGSFAVIVHLPGLLSASVSGRVQTIVNTGLLTVDLSGLFASSTPLGSPQVGLFGGWITPDSPLVYVAWFLPFFAFVRWRELVDLLSRRISVVIVLAVGVIGVLLPSDFGPLRIPLRMMPYVVMTVLIILAVGMSRAPATPLSRRRLGFALAYVVASGWLTFVQAPKYGPAVLAAVAASGFAVWVVYRIGTRADTTSGTAFAPFRRIGFATSAAIVAIVGSVAFVLPQHYVQPRGPLLDYEVGTELADFRSQLAGAEGDTIVVGGVLGGAINADDWAETLVANLWYIPDPSVQNAYTVVFYPGYQDKMCMEYQGSTCPELYERLFEPQPETGLPLADLIGVSSVQVVKSDVPEDIWRTVPDGWHIVSDTERTRLIVRDAPVPGAGSVVWTSEGTRVQVDHADEMGVTFTVDEVPEGGGTVALSRIPWPGYSVDGGTIAEEPIEGFLLGVDVPAGSDGSTVTVSYRAPGWPLQLAAAILLVVVLLGWSALRTYGRLRPGSGGRLGRWAAASLGPAAGRPASEDRLSPSDSPSASSPQ